MSRVVVSTVIALRVVSSGHAVRVAFGGVTTSHRLQCIVVACGEQGAGTAGEVPALVERLRARLGDEAVYAFASYPSIGPSGRGVSQSHGRPLNLSMVQLSMVLLSILLPVWVARLRMASPDVRYGCYSNHAICPVHSRNCNYSKVPNVSKPDGGMVRISRAITTLR